MLCVKLLMHNVKLKIKSIGCKIVRLDVELFQCDLILTEICKVLRVCMIWHTSVLVSSLATACPMLLHNYRRVYLHRSKECTGNRWFFLCVWNYFFISLFSGNIFQPCHRETTKVAKTKEDFLQTARWVVAVKPSHALISKAAVVGWLACLNIFNDSPVFIHLLSTVCNFLRSLTYLVAYSWFSSSIIQFFLLLCQVKLFCEPLRWTSTSPPGAVW